MSDAYATFCIRHVCESRGKKIQHIFHHITELHILPEYHGETSKRLCPTNILH